jgi:segregation and condensation protein A
METMFKEIKLKLESFEGPMDLLLALIDKNKIDIYDIPIAVVTDQYMEYLSLMQAEKMDNMSEFIVMASKLLKIKSRMLLPKTENTEDEGDPRDELVSRLIEYKLFKQLAEGLDERQENAGNRYFGSGDKQMLERVRADVPIRLDEILKGVTRELLDTTYTDLIRRAEVKPNKAKTLARAVYVETFKIEEKMEYIQNLLRINETINFKTMFRKNSTKTEIVVTFMAMLELIKGAKVVAVQNEAFGEIVMRAC